MPHRSACAPARALRIETRQSIIEQAGVATTASATAACTRRVRPAHFSQACFLHKIRLHKIRPQDFVAQESLHRAGATTATNSEVKDDM
jgi:hypothetical protein